MTEMVAALIRLRDERFGGNATALAKAFGISHPYMSHLLSGRVGAGKKLCRAYAAFTGTSIDDAFRMAEGPAADPAACEHPNEAPHVCPCPPGCYCKARTCRPVDAPRIVAVAADSPIPMLIWCPICRARHVDAGEFATKPHHTHSCQECGLTWRPAVVCTVGVEFLPGFKNKPEVSQ